MKKSKYVEPPTVVLPEEMTEPSDRLEDYLILLYGEKKIGKTAMSCRMEDSLHIMTERGGKAQRAYQVLCGSWTEFKQYIRLLEKTKRFRHVTVDIVDILFRMCQHEVCQKRGIEHPSDEGYGKAWDALRSEFTLQLSRLTATGRGVMFISHSSEREIKKRSGGTYDVISPTMPGQARDILEGMVDIWGYAHYEDEKRVIQIIGDDEIAAGHRLESRFIYTDGTPIKFIPMGDSPDEAYANFVAAFNNELVKPKPEKKAVKLVVKKGER